MPINGEYAPSPETWVRNQVETYEASDGQEGTTLRGMPVVVLTTIGAKSGKVRKVPLMRVEHEGAYAAVASLGGAPKNPVWYYNLTANPALELRDGAQNRSMTAREGSVPSTSSGGHGRWPPTRTTPTISARPIAGYRCSSSSRPTDTTPVAL